MGCAIERNKYVVGIDAGGTGVRAALAEVATGNIIGDLEAQADPAGSPAPLSPLLAPLLGTLPPDSVAAVVAGITKISRANVKDSWERALSTEFPLASRHCVADYVIAFHGSLESGVGIAVVAGTGSVVYGENADGLRIRVGGRGWEFGDEGSGAWMTSEIVRRTLHALDGLRKHTELTRAVCEFLSTEDPSLLGEAARQHALESGRGFLAPLALELAQGDNAEAKALFVGAGGWLAAQVRAAANRLMMGPIEPIRIARIGGMWNAGALLAQPFGDIVTRYLPNATISDPVAAPLAGAVRMALRATGYSSTSPRLPAVVE